MLPSSLTQVSQHRSSLFLLSSSSSSLVWTVDLLNSPMALDPVVGFQLLRCLRSFLRIRREALPAPAAEPAAESQDEYGDFDFDYNDPALAAILGEEAVAADVQVNTAESEMKAMDMALAEVSSTGTDASKGTPLFSTEDVLLLTRGTEYTHIHQIIRDHLSPAIYRLLSNINVVSLGQDTGVPDIPDRDTYISELVAAWSEMAAITVHHNLRVRTWVDVRPCASALIMMRQAESVWSHSFPLFHTLQFPGLVLLHERVRQRIVATNDRRHQPIPGWASFRTRDDCV